MYITYKPLLWNNALYCSTYRFKIKPRKQFSVLIAHICETLAYSLHVGNWIIHISSIIHMSIIFFSLEFSGMKWNTAFKNAHNMKTEDATIWYTLLYMYWNVSRARQMIVIIRTWPFLPLHFAFPHPTPAPYKSNSSLYNLYCKYYWNRLK
jgi:hypothetical protein